jgi:hypothetical protein
LCNICSATKPAIHKALANVIFSYPLFPGFSGSFFEESLIPYVFQPDRGYFAQHSGITLLGTLWAHCLLARLEDLKRQETLNGVLQGIHDEIQALWTTYKEGMGDALEALEDNTPFFGYYPLTQEYCTIYTGNSSLIGQIRDHNLRKAIVTTYLMFKVVLDSYKVHNEIQREHSSWHMMQGQTNNVVHKGKYSANPFFFNFNKLCGIF